jgi:hypothetical protein
MKNLRLTIIITFILTSCSSTKKVSEKRCKSVSKSDYQYILEDKFESIVNNKQILLNEVKYECVYSSFYTQKGMYDRFGKWDNLIYAKGSRHPILLWNNVKLFPNDTTEFIVAANGLESTKTTYASVLVFDKKNNDLLTEQSEYKKKLIDYFSKMIKSNNSKKRDFYEKYWKTVNPEHWEYLKQFKKNK